MGDKAAILQGDEIVIRVTKRRIYHGFRLNVWARGKKKIERICLVS